MEFIPAGGITVHYSLEGRADGPTLVFINSIGTDLRIWDRVAAALADRYRLLRYDMRGHGLTDVTPGPYSIASLAEDCAALLDALGLEQVHVCGLSIGGMVAQQLAASYPQRVRSAVFCDTAMRIGTPEMWNERAAAVRTGGMEAIADAVMQRWFTETTLERGVAGYRNLLCRTSPEGYAACCEAIRDADLRPLAAAICIPALVLVGDADLATPPAVVKELADALPNARFETIAGAAHLPCLEKPEQVAASIRAFLSRN